ncbi:MAG: hypothetical protein IPL38_16820 [Rhodobacter sp.]|nr:hypothetical protein [Rhodobacter sp.]
MSPNPIPGRLWEDGRLRLDEKGEGHPAGHRARLRWGAAGGCCQHEHPECHDEDYHNPRAVFHHEAATGMRLMPEAAAGSNRVFLWHRSGAGATDTANPTA